MGENVQRDSSKGYVADLRARIGSTWSYKERWGICEELDRLYREHESVLRAEFKLTRLNHQNDTLRKRLSRLERGLDLPVQLVAAQSEKISELEDRLDG